MRTTRVMSEIERLPPPRAVASTSRMPWWSRYWTIRLSPLRGAALAAGLAVLVLGIQLARRGESPAAPVNSGAAAGGQLTQFVLVAPAARAVTLVGDFNDWSMSAMPLERAQGDGVWHVSVPLAPGRYRYAFVVDGTVWRNDPESPAKDDEFGRPNSVVTVGGG